MKFFLILIILLSLFGCGQDYNSQSNDIGQYSQSPIDRSTPEGERLYLVYRSMQTNCFSCHGSWSSYTTSNQWVSAGLVVRGNPNTSKIVYRLKNMGSNMPPDPSSQISDDDYSAYLNWINNL